MAWTGFGPDSTDTATREVKLYTYLRTNRCDDVLSSTAEDPGRLLYRAAAEACLAARHGRTDLWPAAERDLAAAGMTGPACLGHAVQRLGADLVRAHHTYPTGPPRIVESGVRHTCPFRVTAVHAEGDLPPVGPTSGRTSVTISGEGFYEVTKVYFGTTPVYASTGNTGDLIDAESPPHAAGTVSITVEGTAGRTRKSASATFRYEDSTLSPDG